MISELTNEEILEYLMTSDFLESHRPSEYKYLLHKFRECYKILYGNHIKIKGDNLIEIRQLIDSIESFKKELHNTQIKNKELQDTIDTSKKSRKLTIKERIIGETNQF